MNKIDNAVQKPLKIKRVTWVILLCLSAALFAGCGSNEPSQTVGDNASGASEVGSFSENDIAVVIDGKTYRCGEDVSALLKELGDGYKYSEAISCAYDGLDKTYGYDNYDVYTYPDGKTDRVSEITVYGGDAATPKGLKVGDTVDRLKELYGSGYSEEGITLVYEIPPKQEKAESASLYVTAEDGVIKSIAITAELLTE